MKIFNNTKISRNYKNSALAIGNFDGIHKGHQKVFGETKKFAKRKKIKFGVLTFTPLPIMFFHKNIKNFRLTSEDQKIQLFKKHQVDFVINVRFNKNFSKINAENFITFWNIYAIKNFHNLPCKPFLIIISFSSIFLQNLVIIF